MTAITHIFPPANDNVETGFAELLDLSRRARAAMRGGERAAAYRLVATLILMKRPRAVSPAIAALFERRRASAVLDLSDLDMRLRKLA